MTTLSYKAINIAKAEREFNKNFFSSLSGMSGVPSVNDLLFLVRAGGGTDEEFEELFSKGFENVILAIMEGVNDAGFLGQKIDVEDLRKKLNEAIAETSQNTGEKTKE